MSIEKVPYQVMLEQLSQMPKEEINRHLDTLGCKWDYDQIHQQLETTYNDLQVADVIFSNGHIDDCNSCYPKSFIDEAVYEIATRESFSFTHYGIIARELEQAMEQHDVTKQEQIFRKLLKLAKQFSLTSMEGIMYEVNDGIDLLSYLAQMLDEMQQQARIERTYAKKIVDFIEKYGKVFTNTSPFTKVMLQYEQAQAYILLRSSKGEQMFKQLLKTHSDPTDVVLHYGLAYLDDDSKKTLKIFNQYQRLLDPKSESYEEISEVKHEIERRKNETA